MTSQTWDTHASPGPAGLYTHFVYAALNEILPEIDRLDDETRTLVTQAVDLAIRVVTTAHNIPFTWTPQYTAILDAIKPTGGTPPPITS